MKTPLFLPAAVLIAAVCVQADGATIDLFLFDETGTNVVQNEVAGRIQPTMRIPPTTPTNLHVSGGAFAQSAGAMSQPTSPAANYVADSTGASGTIQNWTQLTHFTIQMWVNPAASTATVDAINYRGQGLRLHDIGGDNYTLRAYVYTGSGYTATPIAGALTVAANSWNHIAMTWDGATLRTYVNGVLGPTAAPTNTSLANDGNPLTIGAYSTASNFYKGLIDEIQVDNHALLPGDGTGGGYLAFNKSLVPEPGTAAMCLLGAVCLGLRRARA